MVTGIRAEAVDYRFNMSYIYFGNSSAYTQLVDASQQSLNEVSPNYFSLDLTGSLVITNAANRSFVDNMHTRGIRVVPYISNDWVRVTGIGALNNRVLLSDSIAQAVSAYNLDGINIDLENLTQNQRADYVDFVRLLREKLPAGKTIAVAVAANPNGYSTGWQGSYDYAGLAAYSDYLLLMAYDESYYGSAPGPVASIAFTENSIKYALKLVPKEKLVLGLPFYGRIWSNSGGYPKGYGISNTKILKLLTEYRGTAAVDSTRQSAFAAITISASDTKPVIGGKTLAAGTYTIWYENEQTLKTKLTLVQKYDLKGAGSWSLGQEDSDTWSYYKLWLNGCTFTDIQNSWAKDAILHAFLKHWVTGITPDSFAPDKSLTRAEAAAMLVRMLGYPVEVNTENSFTDTQGHWAEAYINTARRYQLISGIGNNAYAPERIVTRQEIAVMLNNFLSYTAAGQAVFFSDVSPEANPWSYDAISALSENKIIMGYPDGRFGPQNSVSRAEVTALLTRIDKS